MGAAQARRKFAKRRLRQRGDHGWGGIVPAMKGGMAAVLALIMLPIIASIGFFIGVVRFDGSFAAMFAGAMFIALATGVLVGALRIARDAEGPGH